MVKIILKTCKVKNCSEPHQAKGYCMRHYSQWRRNGRAETRTDTRTRNRNKPHYRRLYADAVCKIEDCNKPCYAKNLCEKHYRIDHRTSAYEKRRSANKCVRCGKRKPRYGVVCDQCKQRDKQKRERIKNRRLKDGLCVDCGQKATVTLGHQNKSWSKQRIRSLCKEHYLKWVARRHGGVKNWKILDELWCEQKGLCACTGRRLVLGSTASVDHIIPRDHKGGDTKNNLRWVHWDFNSSKGNRTDAEFLALCKEFIRYNKEEFAS